MNYCNLRFEELTTQQGSSEVNGYIQTVGTIVTALWVPSGSTLKTGP